MLLGFIVTLGLLFTVLNLFTLKYIIGRLMEIRLCQSEDAKIVNDRITNVRDHVRMVEKASFEQKEALSKMGGTYGIAHFNEEKFGSLQEEFKKLNTLLEKNLKKHRAKKAAK